MYFLIWYIVFICFIITCRCDCEIDVCDTLLEIIIRLGGELPRLGIHLHTTEIVLSDQCVLDIRHITRLLKKTVRMYTFHYTIDYQRHKVLTFHDEANWRLTKNNVCQSNH